MLKGLYTAYTGLVNEQHRMDTLTNNLANSTTVGFKKEGATSQSFNSILALKIKDTSEPSNVPRKIGSMSMGVKIGENYTDYESGPLKETGSTYDLAIVGKGFFAVEFTNKADETSTKYTRAGAFTIDNGGYVVNSDGDFLLDTQGRHIKVDPLKETAISANGTIFQDDKEVARIDIVDFQDYNYLEHYGETFFQTVEGAQEVPEEEMQSKILSGYLEHSNVQVVKEMVEMISVSRAYESNQKIVTSYDDSLDIAVNQLGRI